MSHPIRCAAFSVLVPLLVASLLRAGQQTAAPAATPAPAAAQEPAAAAKDRPAEAPPAGAYRLERRTQLVLIPALITDHSGKHVPGLKASDFVVKDNGVVHPIRMVEEITAPPVDVLERTKLPPGTYSNDTLRAKAPLRVVIILFDMLNSHFKDQVPARIQVVKYLREQAPPGTMVSLMGLGRGGLRMYHDLTSDTKGLADELETAMETGRHAISQNLKGEMSETEAEEAFVGHGGFEETHSTGRSDRRNIVLDTMDAFKNIAGAYASIPGRKSLVWVTGGFPLTLDDSKSKSKNGGLPTAVGDGIGDMVPDYEAAWQALNDANVALYPVDMHGLQNTALLNAETKLKKNQPGRQAATQMHDKEERVEDHLQSLTSFAAETGGKAFYSNNDLVQGFREAVADSEASYLLGYYLEDGAKPGWHKLAVNVTRSGVRIRARAGFLVPKPNEAPQVEQALGSVPAGKDAKVAADVNLAMSSPMSYTAIPLTVRWMEASETKTVQGTGADAGKHSVPFQITLPPNATAMGSDGTTLSINFTGLARTTQGVDAADFTKKLEGKLKPDVAKRLAVAGIKFDSSLMLAPGYYNVRFVVRDNISGQVGSVTAPVVVK